MNPIIRCEHVDFGYENCDAVIDLNLDVYSGDYLCVVGENGSGKSTLVKGLLGLLKPTAGTITLAEELRRGGIGYLPQQTAAQRDFPATVYEVVLSGALARRGHWPFFTAAEKKLAINNMERLGILERKNDSYKDLSGGQQQRVLIARALCATQHLLILDEPITGLDPAAIEDFYHLVRRLNRVDGITIIMVSHDVRGVLSQAKRVLHMQQRVLFLGSVEDYRKSEAAAAFLGGGDL
ncbi:MAG: metal ABC transporter ATP-binding protein [Clostridiales bacterium]|nr:metal ABC transporter ATP-binding protein [Clostridiales bacterium]MCD8223603.1 metal ABC transporter ATP-binding protein [Clostridiales bacterium]